MFRGWPAPAGTMSKETLRPIEYLALSLGVIGAGLLSLCLGSVNVPLKEIWAALFQGGDYSGVIVQVRLPRTLVAGLMGACLSLAGGAMQGLLRNPLADGSTLGVSSGAALGAVLAIGFGLSLGGVSAVTPMAILFAFLSLLLILSLAFRLDYSLSTNTIILLGVIFSMFAGSLISLMVTFAGEKVKTIVFWTMGSLASSSYSQALILALALLACGGLLLAKARELNAFAIGEDNARNLGIEVRRVKLVVLVSVSVLIGVAVSIGGTIAFVGLVIPHMVRLVLGPNHRRLLPTCLFAGSAFLMLADLLSRTLLSPRELPIGVITSLIGSVIFVYIFSRNRRIR